MVEFATRRLAEKVETTAVPVHVLLIEETWPVKLGSIEQPAEPVRKRLFEQRLTEGVLT